MLNASGLRRLNQIELALRVHTLDQISRLAGKGRRGRGDHRRDAVAGVVQGGAVFEISVDEDGTQALQCFCFSGSIDFRTRARIGLPPG